MARLWMRFIAICGNETARYSTPVFRSQFVLRIWCLWQNYGTWNVVMIFFCLKLFNILSHNQGWLALKNFFVFLNAVFFFLRYLFLSTTLMYSIIMILFTCGYLFVCEISTVTFVYLSWNYGHVFQSRQGGGSTRMIYEMSRDPCVLALLFYFCQLRSYWMVIITILSYFQETLDTYEYLITFLLSFEIFLLKFVKCFFLYLMSLSKFMRSMLLYCSLSSIVSSKLQSKWQHFRICLSMSKSLPFFMCVDRNLS